MSGGGCSLTAAALRRCKAPSGDHCQIRSSRWSRQQIRNQILTAHQAGHEHFDLHIQLPPGSLESVREYLSVLEEADDWGVRGRLLTQTPDADVLALRRRYITALAAQIADATAP